MNHNGGAEDQTGYYAMLTADVRVSPGPETHLTLRCAGRQRICVTAKPELIPPYFWCHRSCATVQLRTDLYSRLRSSLCLLSLVSLTDEKNSAEPLQPISWSAAGLVAAEKNALVVFSRNPRIRPSRIYYRPEPGMDLRVLPNAGESVTLQGVLRAGVLTATAIHNIGPLRRPRGTEHWRRWL